MEPPLVHVHAPCRYCQDYPVKSHTPTLCRPIAVISQPPAQRHNSAALTATDRCASGVDHCPQPRLASIH
eukprot:6260082-Pyramimonas_sp.AAC.1